MAIWIDAFKAGIRKDSIGRERNWTESDLDTIVNKYNNQSPEEKRRAPVVLGHPKTNDPAYGWVDSLKREGTKLKASLTDLDKKFVDWVNAGRYKERSISLYPDLKLRHIGFLGAVQPAVPGLAPLPTLYSEPETDGMISIDFSLDENSICIEFSDSDFADPASQTIAEALTARDERAIKFGITVKSNGNLIKPDAYKDIPDDKFADPVNYKYPINDLPNVLASKSEFRTWDDTYSDEEKHVIMAAILKAAIDNNVDVLKTENFFYSEPQNADKNGNKSIQINNPGENEMNDGTKTVDTIDHSDTAQSKEILELTAKFQAQEQKIRDMEFNEFYNKNLDRLTPAQKPIVKALYDMAFSMPSPEEGFSFSDGTNIIKLDSGIEVVKAFIGTMKEHKLTSEFASNGTAPVPADSLEEQRKLIDERNKNKNN